jgi:hypothetical protein
VGFRIALMIQVGLSAFNAYLAALTPALLIMRWCHPHPSLRRVVRQRGTIACAVATAATVIEALWIASVVAVGSDFIHASTVFVGYVQQVSFAGAGAWFAMALSGRWRPEAS